ncbi:hypothetical protein Tco_1293112 [Tanacetum coccineum]
MFSNPHHLWVKVIKALHGIEGGFDYKGYYFNGTWAKIVGSLNYLHSNGFLPSNSLSFKVGSGTRIHFLKDTWIGDSPLCTRYSRIYQLDQDKDCLIMDRFQNGQWHWSWSRQILGIRTSAYLRDMLNEINQIIPNDVEDSCIWSIANDGAFSVGLWMFGIVFVLGVKPLFLFSYPMISLKIGCPHGAPLKIRLAVCTSSSCPLCGGFGELSEKKMLWDYLIVVIANWNGDVVIMGDFNEVRTQAERYGSIFNVQGADAFNSFILAARLEEVSLANMSDTNAISKLLKKLKFLKDQTHVWIKDKKEYAYKQKKTLKEKLADIDLLLDKGEGNYDILNKKIAISKSLQDIEKLASLEVAQKVKIKWEIEGDENSKYYHAILNKRRCQLPICGILVDGTWIDSLSLVKSEFLSHFTNRFNQPETSRLLLNINFLNRLNLDKQIDLESDVTHDEIKRVVWDCGIDKSLDPDEFTFGFYRRYWSFLEKDVV